ncbi:MAG: sulfatase-like hydrolase/transferase [Chloroflexota bacterium]
MQRPNILLLYVDQMRWDCLGANGNTEIITPNLDQLAIQGTSFTHCFVQHPLCMPSRVSMLSGQYPATLGITHMGVPVPEDLPILPTFLKRAGYRTANIGKLHFQPHPNRDHRDLHPAYDFDHLEISDEPGVYEDAYRAWVRAKKPHQMDLLSVGLPPATKVWYDLMGQDNGVVHPDPLPREDFDYTKVFRADDDMTHTAFVAEQTQNFLQQHLSRQPFLCIAGFYSPHAPMVVPQTYLDLYDSNTLSLPMYPPDVDAKRPASGLFSDAHLRDIMHGYYAMISEVDYHVGKILDTLEDTGLADNTIIVFTSDHGEWLGNHLRFAKGYPADDGASRVPLIIKSPFKHAMPVSDAIVEAVDIVPTLLELVALQIPSHLQGKSLLPLLRGDVAHHRDSALVEGNGWKNIRTRQFRYLVHADGNESLWDIVKDADEYDNVANDSTYRSALAECRLGMLRHLLDIERPRKRTWVY